MAIVMGVDLQSDPDCAAFEQLMSKDIFQEGNILHIPPKVDKEKAMPMYKAIEDNFDRLKTAGKLEPLLFKLKSAYMKCTYSHGQHTSRADTYRTQDRHGLYDHIIYNPERLHVKELLEIPLEMQLAPSGAVKDDPSCA
jgi:hypothetical protein